MFKPQFNTPYLLSADGYKRYFYVFDRNFKVRPVYMTKRSGNGNECELAIYNDDMTEEIDRVAWVSIYELQPYSLDSIDEIENELQEYFDEFEDADELDEE